MKNFFETIRSTDFRKPVRRLLLITLAVVLVCAVLTAVLFRPQLAQLAALKNAQPQSELTAQAAAGSSEDGDTHDCGGEDGDAHDSRGEEMDLFDSGLIARPSGAAVAGGVVSLVLCGLCALAWWLLTAAWLYKAAAQAGMNRALWGVLGLLANLAAVLVFWIVRGRMTRCPACGAWQKAAPYCSACGAPLQRICPRCGRVCAVSSAFCPGCGVALQGRANAEAGRM